MTFHLLVILFRVGVALAAVAFVAITVAWWYEGRRIQRHGDRPWR